MTAAQTHDDMLALMELEREGNKELARQTKLLEDLVATLSFQRASQVGPSKTTAIPAPPMPGDVSTLGDWKPFERGGGHWIFATKNFPLRDTLLAARAQGKDHVDMAGYRFKLSGDEDKFINKFPLEGNI